MDATGIYNSRKFLSVKQAGFSMVELAIALTLMSFMLTGYIKWQAIATEQAQGEMEADRMMQFQYFISAFYKQNQSAMNAAMWSGTDANATSRKFCVVGATDYDNSTGVFTGGDLMRSDSLKTCAIDDIFLNYKGFWIGQPTPVTNRRFVAIFKKRDNLKSDAEVLIVKMEPDKVLTTAEVEITNSLVRNLSLQNKLGARGGFVAIGQQGPINGTKTMTMAGGANWSVNLEEFIDTNELNIIKSILPNE